MSEDHVAYSLPGETPEVPPSRRSVREKVAMFPKLAVGFALGVGVGALLSLIPRDPPAPSPAQTTRPVQYGRLADAVGEDVLYRLEVTQAAMQREMAFLREWVTKGAGGLPEEADLARVLSTLNVRQDELDGLAAHLREGQARLRDMAMMCRMELSEQSQRLSEQQQALAEHLAEGRD